MQMPGTIVVGYAPSEQVAWEAVVAKTPVTVNSDKQPEMDPDDWWIIDDCHQALYYGVLSRLQSQPTKPYTNAALAKYNNAQYVSQRSKSRTDVLKKNTFGAQAWSFPQQFATVARKGWV